MRSPARSGEETDVFVESDLLRTVLFTMILGGLASLLGYFSYRVVLGEGRSIFYVTATLAVFLACGAAACRRRRGRRFVLLLGFLCASAMCVDQVVYYRWHTRVDRLVTSLRRRAESGSPLFPRPVTISPTSFSIDPDQEVLLTFEPPILAWTYHLNTASPLGHAFVGGWYDLLARLTRGRDLDRVALTIVRPHEATSVDVGFDARARACQEGDHANWILSINTLSGDRRL